MAQILPYSAILCHFRTFCKENLYFNRQPLCFHHFAKPRPLTSRYRRSGGSGSVLKDEDMLPGKEFEQIH